MGYGLHIIEFPTKKWGFVGSIPVRLGKEVKATPADVMAGRAYKNSAGEIVTVKFPTFDTKEQAETYVSQKGY